MISTSIAVWAAAIVTFMIWSYAYKENVFFRIGEHTMLGLTIAYWWVLAIKSILNIGVNPLYVGAYSSIIPLILGVLLLMQFINKVRWISRWPLAIIVGISVGVAARAALDTNIIGQIIATAIPLVRPTGLDTLNNIIIVVFVVLGILYFYFTREFTGPLATVNKLGRYSYVIVLGALYGGTIMTRLSYLIGRLTFLIHTWLGL